MVATGVSQVFQLPEPASSHAAIEAQLIARFDAAWAEPTAALAELRAAANAYGRAVRRKGRLPEHLVLALKTLLCCRGGFASLPSMVDEQSRRDALSGNMRYARVLDWCLEGYFDEQQPRTCSGSSSGPDEKE